MKYTLSALAVATMSLSGCDSEFFDDSSPSSASFDNQTITFIDEYNDQLTMSQTSVGRMPIMGSATYSGVAGFLESPTTGNAADYSIFADLSMTADFGTGQMNGEMTNFNVRDGTTLDGSLRLSNGQIAGNGFVADAIGTVDYGTDPLAWDLDVQGNFMGSSGQAISGTANGVISDGSPVTTPIYGDFYASE